MNACRRYDLPVVISVLLGAQRVFQAGLPGSSVDNERSAELTSRLVAHFGLSSLDVWQHVGGNGDQPTLLAASGRASDECCAAGGAVPIQVAGSLVGVVAVSGLEPWENHQFAATALRELAEQNGN